MSVKILIGDCRERMRDLEDSSVDSVVCDPPYHLTSIVKRFGSANAAPAQSKQSGVYARSSKGFMGQTWDGGDVAFDPATWTEVLRVLKPGGHLVAFSGTRTYHRMAVAIEDAGFEIRDQLAWVYGSGFPKSLDVSKAIDKQRDDKPDIHRVCAFVAAGRDAAGKANREIDALFGFNGMAGHWTNSKGPQAQVPRWEQWLQLRAFLNLSDEMDAEVWRLNGRKGQPGEAWQTAEVVGVKEGAMSGWSMDGTTKFVDREIKAANSEAAQQWQGWGTALKPSLEPVCFARKPFTNEQEWATIRALIEGLWAALWRALPANDAVKDSTLNPHACGVDPRASAQWSAEQLSNTRAALSEAMDMSRFELALTSSLNTASSWNATLADLCRAESMSIIGTASSTTIDLRTLRFCLSRITPESIILAHRSGAWSSADACNAARYLNATLATLDATRELSALAPAIEQDHRDSLDAGATPNLTPICLARKPLDGTVANNVLTHGTGALNIDGCRIEHASDDDLATSQAKNPGREDTVTSGVYGAGRPQQSVNAQGRWPANLCHDGSDEVLAGFPETSSGELKPWHNAKASENRCMSGGNQEGRIKGEFGGDSGSAARFFATFPIGEDEWEFAKSVHAASAAESPCGSCGTPIVGDPAATLTLGSRSAGSQAGRASIGICESCIPSLSPALIAASLESTATIPTIPSCSKSNGSATPVTERTINQESAARAVVVNDRGSATRFLYCPKATTEERGEGNNHPTVKPVALMRWLCRLVTPKGGTVLDPFMGSGSTGLAADAEQFDFIGCELSTDYAEIARRRICDQAGMFADVEVVHSASARAA